ALPGDRVVGRADAGEEHQPHVVEGVSTEDDDVGGLLEFAPAGVDIRHAGRALPVRVEIHPDHVRKRPDLAVFLLEERRYHRRGRVGLRALRAGVAGAEAAAYALAQHQLVRVQVGLRLRGNRIDVSLVAQLLAGGGEHRSRVGHGGGRVRILPRAWSLERIPAVLDHAHQVAGLAADTV